MDYADLAMRYYIEQLRSMPYEEYLKTPHWQRMRKRAIERAGCRCQKCPSNDRLDVHHLIYARLGAELFSDLEVLCHRCHWRQEGHGDAYIPQAARQNR